MSVLTSRFAFGVMDTIASPRAETVYPTPRRQTGGRFLHFLAGSVVLALLTLTASLLHLNLTTAAFLYLIVIVVLARYAGFWVASGASMVAVGLQIYFLVPPVLSWTVADPANWISLAVFEYCALVVSRLSATAARRSLEAEERQRETERLYEASRLVLLMDRQREPAPQLACLIQGVFGCDAVAIFDAGSVQYATAGVCGAGLERKTRDTYLQAKDGSERRDRTWFCILRIGTRPIGAIALCGGLMTGPLANALSALVAVAIERSRAFERESCAEAARHNEQLRTAVLDALAHDVKTPLTAIRAASSGLLEAGALTGSQTELISLIDEQAAAITELTNRLLRMAKLDGKDVRVRLAGVRVSDLIRRVLSAESRIPGRVVSTFSDSDDLTVSGDHELLAIVLTQIVDNALKYSRLDSEIRIMVSRVESEAVVSIHNSGRPISPRDLERIFERFYRGALTTHQAAGTGLGLAIARKIATAHGGRLWAVSNEVHGTTFHLALPLWAGSPGD